MMIQMQVNDTRAIGKNGGLNIGKAVISACILKGCGDVTVLPPFAKEKMVELIQTFSGRLIIAKMK